MNSSGDDSSEEDEKSQTEYDDEEESQTEYDDDEDQSQSEYEESEFGSESEEEDDDGDGEESDEGDEDIFDDEFEQAEMESNASNRIEFTGMEAVEKVEKMKADIPTRGPARSGDDLLRQYMGVLHGGGGGGGRGDDSLDGMENKIAKGLSGHGRGSADFILNQSDDMSVGSRSTRQSRREAVMVARRLDFLEDEPTEMTYTRQIALHLMKKYKWYNPRLGEPPEEVDELESSQMGGAYRTPDGYPMLKVKPENPSLEAAWAYFGG